MIGNAIRKLRHEKGLSQTEFANLCGLTSYDIDCFENGERKPSLEQLEKIANTFGVDMSYFLRKKQNIVKMSEVELKDCVNENPELVLLLRMVVSFSSEKMKALLSVADALSKHGGGKINCVVIEEDRMG